VLVNDEQVERVFKVKGVASRLQERKPDKLPTSPSRSLINMDLKDQNPPMQRDLTVTPDSELKLLKPI
jgi:hypothetical protein